jgi:RNA polymerase sigma-70 factor, ECF subfamily
MSPDAAGSDDRALVRAAQAGDERALNRLLERHYDRVHAICRRMMGNEPDAQDATQDALIALVRGLPRYDGRAAFTTWAYRVTTNACIDELRRRRRRPLTSMEAVEATSVSESDLDDGLADRLLIDEALAGLPPEFRAAVVLRDGLGLDYNEIAAVLDIPAGTVRSRIARGRRALANHLAGNSARSGIVEKGAP